MSDVALDKNQWNRLNGKLDVDPIDVPADYTFNDGLRQRLYFTGDEANPSVDDIKMVYGYPGGAEDTITGWKAIYSARDKNGDPAYKGPNQTFAYSQRRMPGDERNSFSWELGQSLRREMQNTHSSVKKFFSDPVGGTMGAAALGAGGLALASWLGDKFGYNMPSPTSAALVGAGLSSGFYWWLAEAKRRAREQKQMKDMLLNKSGSVMKKKATLYHDPRNFILEKLQRDTQLSMSDKAMLAGKIRSMSLPDASALEKTVRGALGAGVGMIIARYFGLGVMGTLMGGALGAVASNAMHIGDNAFEFTRRPSLFNAFMQRGYGFDSYNEFFRSVNKGV